jgi:hypothetical protein
MKRYMYVLLCEACLDDVAAYEKYAEEGDAPWKPCLEAVASFPMYKTKKAAFEAAQAKHRELDDEETKKLRRRKPKPYLVFPTDYVIKVFGVTLGEVT